MFLFCLKQVTTDKILYYLIVHKILNTQAELVYLNQYYQEITFCITKTNIKIYFKNVNLILA